MEKLLGQKRLERIILINSSTFRYAEVSVDGNTHISGDNSSGKSTFLQIETLFYTGDSSAKALGIGDGKLPFAQYNLKMNNSFIIYEVRRSNEPDDRFIVFLKNTNWPTFQFFNCPYSKDIFIDENGVAYDNLEQVKNAAQRLYPGIDMRQVRGRKEYIDVLYGWRDGIVGKMRSWEKFSLTSCRGIDRPHEKITNLLKMLLNLGKVQGNVLKEMIVSSMDFTAKPFDVGIQQERASMLMKQYNCIRTWTSDTNILNKQKQFVKNYESYLQEKIDFEQYPGKAKFARDFYQSMAKDITLEKEQALAELDAYTKAAQERQEVSQGIIEELKDKRSRLQGDFDKIAQKKGLYTALMPLLPLMASADQKQESLRLASKRLEDLSGKSSSLKERFDGQKNELRKNHEIWLSEAETVMARKKADAALRKNEISDSIEEERSAEERRHTEKLRLLASRKDAMVKAINETNLDIQRLKSSHPKGEEIKALKEKETALSQEIKKIEKELIVLQQTILSAENEKKSIPSSIRLKYSNSIHEKEDLIRQEQKKYDALAQRLSTFDGSLAEWLSRNVDGWGKTLGKVLSEDVLFSQQLSPEKVSGDSTSIYGISLDLSSLSPTDTDPVQLQEKLDSIRLARDKAEKALEDEKSLVESAINEKLAEVNKKVDEANKQAEILSDKKTKVEEEFDAFRTEIDSLVAEEQRLIEASVSKKEAQLKDSEESLTSVKKQEENENRDYDLFCRNLRSRRDEQHKKIQKELDGFGNEQKALIDKKKEELRENLLQLDEDCAQALSKEGVDMSRIKALQDEISSLDAEVRTISANTLLYHDYLRDKAEFFDREDEWSSTLKGLSESIRKNEQDEREKSAEELKVISEKKKVISEFEGEIANCNHQVSIVDSYFSENRKEDFEKAEPIENSDAAEVIIEHDTGSKGKIENNLNVLEMCWASFRNSLQDFGIRLFFPISASCTELREDPVSQKEVYQFITNNLIDDFRKAWNAAAVPFVSGISYQATEYATAIKRVRETVGGINRLFREYNFTDVIKRMELSVEDVGSDLIALIKRSTEIHEDYCGDSEDNRDFLDGSTINKKFISFIQEIASNLAKNNNEQITLEDMFTLYIEVDEGLNRSGRRRDIKDMGSNGIDTIFKNILYLLLLTNIRKRCVNDGQGFMIHCPIDEQATLSPSNFNSLMQLANRIGVYILANSPVLPNGTEESFRNAYTFWKRPGSEFTNSMNTLSFNEID